MHSTTAANNNSDDQQNALAETQQALQHALMDLNGLHLELNLQTEELDKRQKELRSLRTSQLKYRQLFESSPIGYMVVDQFAQILEANPATAALIGKRRHQITRTPISVYVETSNRELLRDNIQKASAGKESRIQVSLTNATRKKIPVELYLYPTKDPVGGGGKCLIAILDVSEHKENETQLQNAKAYLQHLATHDALTSLPNRRHFQDELDVTIAAARRKASNVAVLMLDLDRFKVINDTLGHEAGDELLQETAKRLTAAVRKQDIVARLGGDEFTVILTELDNMQIVEDICESIRRHISKPLQLKGHSITMACSIGVAMYPTDSVHSKELTKYADAAMYSAKSSGTNCIRFFTTDLSASLNRRFQLENDLQNSIRNHQIEVWFQPIFDVQEQQVVSVEALARWRHPTRGMISPSEFICLAEDCGAIEPLGYEILHQACEQVGELKRESFPDLSLSVNISPRQFAQPGFVRQVKDTLKLTKLDPANLQLEVTETTVFQDDTHSMHVMNELQALGVRFAIDDFGVGYSSLARLRRLPIDCVKIDRSFVMGVPGDSDNCAITSAVVSMTRDLGLSVIAEGVETHDQLNYLRSIGCSLVQGFLLGEPIPASATKDKLQNMHSFGAPLRKLESVAC